MRFAVIRENGLALAVVFAGAMSALACAGVNPATMGMGVSEGGESCRLNSDGTQTCGYNCVMGSDGRHACASTPDGSCRMTPSGAAQCDDAGQEASPASPAVTDTTSPSQPSSGDDSGGGADATCCVNGAFYDCPSLNDVGICVGEPMNLMNCMGACDPMSSGTSCEDACMEKHGPKPQDSECSREPSRDNECSR